MGKILAICTSPRRGTVKTAVPSAVLTPEWGIVGDVHGGNWHRQVSMLSAEKIEQVGGKGRQNRCQRRVAEGEARIAGHHAPALCKGKPRRQPGRHRKQQHVGGAAADSVTEQRHQQAACRTAHAAQYHAP